MFRNCLGAFRQYQRSFHNSGIAANRILLLREAFSPTFNSLTDNLQLRLNNDSRRVTHSQAVISRFVRDLSVPQIPSFPPEEVVKETQLSVGHVLDWRVDEGNSRKVMIVKKLE